VQEDAVVLEGEGKLGFGRRRFEARPRAARSARQSTSDDALEILRSGGRIPGEDRLRRIGAADTVLEKDVHRVSISVAASPSAPGTAWAYVGRAQAAIRSA
jgi:hypothetical protein